MKRKKMAEDEGTAELSCYMMKVIDDLMAGKKYPAVHTYISTLRSFIRFSGGRDVKLPMQEVFTPGRLKEYESWLMVQRKLSLNTVSTYMRTLQAVYNGCLWVAGTITPSCLMMFIPRSSLISNGH